MRDQVVRRGGALLGCQLELAVEGFDDKADAQKLARYGLDNWSELREYSPMDEIRYNLS